MTRKTGAGSAAANLAPHSPWRHLPNLLSISRVLSIPIIFWLSLSQENLWALVVFGYCAVTDLLDGFLAKRFGWDSRFGALLDPVADRIFVCSLIPLLWHLDAINSAYTLLVVLRFSIQLSVFPVLFWWLKRPVRVIPGLLSKAAMALAFVVLGMGFAKQLAIEMFSKASGATVVFDHTLDALTVIGCLLEVWVLIKFLPRYWDIIREREDTIV
ncbi:CDP-alcohol phosphatidyltransferase family protein [Microbulbifer hydrolyticus]|uniref:CDP-diacylglycerol--glycerol-3-phosphate 3-phosphatidyltransferase n=1 Tax=Microbulbifer hydrolyticus TaxID=48074 RepID=A0A6P1TGH2_9GAMM|nr:CDP-alcohol phosphatidyltransferase family protein [Microbulbifer hydrolyticus]MBB5211775.1 phosphatidylglycerophosphate synthase [Microbulbifer hydrolyticus]QHQ40630.1 hypothetical protein GTQ55_17685 [Microbulbifer hydrolyticus]